MSQDRSLIEIWKETRNTINHLDKMMDGIRVRTFTLFGTISSIAAALNYYVPDAIISGIPLSTQVELILIPVITVLFIQNRMYHYWLYRAVETATEIEGVYEKMKDEIKGRNSFITYSLTRLDKTRRGYWHSMRYSKMFWVDVFILAIMIGTCLGLSFMFAYH